MTGWTPLGVIYGALSFGRYRSDCYYCDRTITSRNFLVEHLKIGTHLTFGHGVGPEDLTDQQEADVREHMTIYGEGPNADPEPERDHRHV